MNASGAGDYGWAPMNSDILCGGDCCVCVCANASRMHARARTRVRACVYARMRVCMRDVFAIYDTFLTQADNNN